MTDGQNFHPVPIVLLAGLLGNSALVPIDAVASVQVIVSVVGREHDQMTHVAVRVSFLLDGLSPKRDARVHFAGDKFALENQSKIAVLLFRDQVRTGRRSVIFVVLGNDDAPPLVNGEVFFRLPLPAAEVFSAEQPDRVLTFRQFADLLLGPVVSGCFLLGHTNRCQKNEKANREQWVVSHRRNLLRAAKPQHYERPLGWRIHAKDFGAILSCPRGDIKSAHD